MIVDLCLLGEDALLLHQHNDMLLCFIGVALYKTDKSKIRTPKMAHLFSTDRPDGLLEKV
jgi:hypothetical protein